MKSIIPTLDDLHEELHLEIDQMEIDGTIEYGEIFFPEVYDRFYNRPCPPDKADPGSRLLLLIWRQMQWWWEGRI